MPRTLSRWHFICEEVDGMVWRWRAVNTVSASFARFDAAVENAKLCGFDPLLCYWMVTADGYTTHYRPGKPPIDLPTGEEPAV